MEEKALKIKKIVDYTDVNKIKQDQLLDQLENKMIKKIQKLKYLLKSKGLKEFN